MPARANRHPLAVPLRRPAKRDGCLRMPPGFWLGIRAALVAVPASLLVMYLGVLELAGLFCDEARRKYVTELSEQAVWAIVALFHGYEPADRTLWSDVDTLPTAGRHTHRRRNRRIP